MKLLLYMVAIIAVSSLLFWAIGKIHPKQQFEYAKSYVYDISSNISSKISDLTSSASKLKNRLKSEYNVAADVYKDSIDEVEQPKTFGFRP
ncbi:MAG: hypothetical protein IJ019_05470 [Alphaproteobacteria bacterium]|nr:hypothetical protein [Alphaproteobacteria bacterium]